MADTSRLRVLFLLHFSKPLCNRPVYQAVARRRVRSILELGVGTGERAVRMIEAAAGHAPVGEIHYTGVDLFEARPEGDGAGTTLKRAHRLLQATGAKIQLAPGDPFAALARTANRQGPTDLVVISAGLEASSLSRAWFYVPRLLHADSLVLAEDRAPSGEVKIRKLDSAEVERLSARATPRRAA